MKTVTVEMYTGPSCGPCVRAKSLLDKKLAGRAHIKLLEFDVKANPERCPEMIERSGGRKTIPQVFVDGIYVGGWDDLETCERSGRLDSLLGICE